MPHHNGHMALVQQGHSCDMALVCPFVQYQNKRDYNIVDGWDSLALVCLAEHPALPHIFYIG